MEYECVSFERCWRHRAESVPHCPSCSDAHSLLRIEMCEVNWPAAMLTVTVGIDCANARSHSEANISLRRKREPLHTVNNLNLAYDGFWVLRECFCHLLRGCNCGKGVVELTESSEKGGLSFPLPGCALRCSAVQATGSSFARARGIAIRCLILGTLSGECRLSESGPGCPIIKSPRLA
jgi:hypothetical protein